MAKTVTTDTKEERKGCKKKKTLPNHNCKWKTVEEEKVIRQKTVEETIKGYQQLLPKLLKDLSQIKDPRQPKKVKHQLTCLLLYGILIFVFQWSSRREAGREISRPVLYENLKQLFPELKTLPHQDTLYRLLKKMQVEEIENAQVHLLQKLIRSKKFRKYLIKKRYLIAIDGTQKYVTNERWADEQLSRHVGGEDKKPQYYVYVLEAKFVFPNGLVLPLMSEFLDNTKDEIKDKQDCEQKGFFRLAKRLKAAFPRLPITLLLDGLYANGPVIAQCRKYGWEFMIVLQNGSLRKVWEEAKQLYKLQRRDSKRIHRGTWYDRTQTFRWANDIEYEYGENDGQKQTVHVVLCTELWKEVDLNGKIVTRRSRHAWLSSEPLDERNVLVRCNQMARSRWGIENDILKEKRQGYHYEHIFSYDWNVMKGYHYLMHIAHLMNELSQFSIHLIEMVQELGIRGFIRFLRETISGPWLDLDQVQQWLKKKSQFRLA
jgi:hypothetical protein